MYIRDISSFMTYPNPRGFLISPPKSIFTINSFLVASYFAMTSRPKTESQIQSQFCHVFKKQLQEQGKTNAFFHFHCLILHSRKARLALASLASYYWKLRTQVPFTRHCFSSLLQCYYSETTIDNHMPTNYTNVASCLCVIFFARTTMRSNIHINRDTLILQYINDYRLSSNPLHTRS